jgi:HEAT repeat protein
MRKNLVIVICILTAIVVAVVLAFALHNREPRYNGKRLSEWLMDLDDQKPRTANEQAIAAVHHAGAKGMPVIINMMQMRDWNHRHHAILACYELGPAAKPAIPILIKLLNDGDTRGYLGAALGQIGPDAIPFLIKSLTNNNEEVRTEVASSLGNGPAFALGTENQKSEITSALINCLGDKSESVRRLAAYSLGRTGAENPLVVPALVKSLNDSDIYVRWNTCLALGGIGPQARAAVPALLAALDQQDIRGTAAIALVEIEPDNVTRVETLMPILISNIEGPHRKNDFTNPSVTALGLWGEKAKPAVPTLVKAAHDKSGYERKNILDALKKIDPAAAANFNLN